MKIIHNILFAIFSLSTFVSWGQEDVLAERLGAHKEWNVAFVRDLRVDSSLTINAILVQAYSDADWDMLLATMGKSSKRICSNDYAENVVIWFADRNTLKEASSESKEDDCFVFARCSERTVALFFPLCQSDRARLLLSYLSKGQLELHKFAQRHRKSREH